MLKGYRTYILWGLWQNNLMDSAQAFIYISVNKMWALLNDLFYDFAFLTLQVHFVILCFFSWLSSVEFTWRSSTDLLKSMVQVWESRIIMVKSRSLNTNLDLVASSRVATFWLQNLLPNSAPHWQNLHHRSSNNAHNKHDSQFSVQPDLVSSCMIYCINTVA